MSGVRMVKVRVWLAGPLAQAQVDELHAVAESLAIAVDFHGHAIGEPAVELSVGLHQASGVAMDDLCRELHLYED